MKTCAIPGRCLPKECGRMRPGLCQKAPGDFLHILFHLLGNLMRFWVNNGVKFCQFGDTFGVSFVKVCTLCAQVLLLVPKNVPACVRGYANRRPGIFYTFHFTFCATCGPKLLAQMCPHASGVMPIGAR